MNDGFLCTVARLHLLNLRPSRVMRSAGPGHGPHHPRSEGRRTASPFAASFGSTRAISGTGPALVCSSHTLIWWLKSGTRTFSWAPDAQSFRCECPGCQSFERGSTLRRWLSHGTALQTGIEAAA